jgi:hypothetical protein
VLVHPKVTQGLKADGKKEEEWRSELKDGSMVERGVFRV